MIDVADVTVLVDVIGSYYVQVPTTDGVEEVVQDGPVPMEVEEGETKGVWLPDCYLAPHSIYY